MTVIEEFKAFALKGNVVDMAVGIVMGVAFNKIVTSLVNDIIMPPLGLAIGGTEFKDLAYTLRDASVDPMGNELSGVAIRYGLFTNTVIEFLIIAMSCFLVVKMMNRIIRKRESQ